ncbi:MAG TPA: bifunctional tRNA (5-methylaminomethyl-2-thiouridine)(34)-methyltransferase MnmD/FAD-dependent 5-carboxymethylaminomethyl-2-thiouridine(34) oxidoreductase MnmC [Rhodocyclaceae bacterium]|nr:bifunctional tRNA (5-methylaminomethyl-2-thiouridine)(34)-methyltransferase MnmD/FAD-dependent 5-carboxymethylaminomethyl-2-thiouridine(34) oxidoreductase MnmC [Rhodocyclaceae bacterium]
MIVPAKLSFTSDGTPYSAFYDDVYHAAAGGLEQARHVFLGGNDLPARWRGRDAFTIVETGFGLGLNFLAAWQAWLDDADRCPRLHFVSFEKHPFAATELALAHRRWPALASLSATLRQQWPVLAPGVQRLNFAADRVSLTLFLGDATTLLPQLVAGVDAYFIDGFAPAKNPELWSPQFLASLTRTAAPDATLATWSVAKAVREGLAACGWTLTKRAGFAAKREMLSGRRGEPLATAPSPERQAVIVGAGLAGTACAERLAARGWSLTIIDRQPGPGLEASGNPAGVLRPLPSMDDNYLARLTRAAYLHGRRHLQALSTAGLPLRWDACGVLHLARDPVNEENQRRLVARHQPPADYFSFVDRDQAARLAGWPVQLGGWWFPGGGWVDPASLCRANLQRHPERIRTLFGCTAERLEHGADGWHVIDATGAVLAAAPVLILACAAEAQRLLPELQLPLRVARGQVNYLPQNFAAPPEIVVCRLGYVTPAANGRRSFGASFVPDNADEGLKIEETRGNLARLEFMLPGYAGDVDPESLPGRAGFRAMTPDRLPLIGALPQADAVLAAAPGATPLSRYPRQSGLYGMLGLGARGLVWSALAGELLAAQLEGEPLPLERELVDAVDPARFVLRGRRRQE